jgi:bifunctional UDP-N-acetylglucosamine pyrophosphorylase/glucosamine-1-phosphate N-acetyltransferase
MGDALLAVKPQLNPNQVLVINPQQINLADHLTAMAQAKITNENVVLFSQPTTTPEKYGLLELNGNRVTSVVEKPTSSVGLSNQRLLGIYLLTDQFLKLLAQTEITKYQLEKTLNTFARNNRVLAVTSSAQTCTLKYAWDLFTISEVFFEQFAKKPVIHRTAQVHPTAIVEGPVIIEEDAKVYEYAIIKGPCYIGRHTVVGSYCKVRSGAVLEEGAQLQSHAEVKHSLIGENTRLHSGFIGDSIIGENVRIGAGFITANRRFDRKTIRITVDGKPVDTGLSAFGALVGDNTSLGIHSGTNPGTVIPANSKIMPGTILPAQK